MKANSDRRARLTRITSLAPRTILAMQAGADRSMAEIAATAARLIVEEGMDYEGAKRRALKLSGSPARTPLPDNDLIEMQVREHIALFHADTQPGELAALRRLGLVWMQRLAEFRPHISGAVWNGTATRHSDIFLQLFCDDPKAPEISLIDHGVRYEAQDAAGFNGKVVNALSFGVKCDELNEFVGIHLMVYERNALRGALVASPSGQKPRGDRSALEARLQESPQ